MSLLYPYAKPNTGQKDFTIAEPIRMFFIVDAIVRVLRYFYEHHDQMRLLDDFFVEMIFEKRAEGLPKWSPCETLVRLNYLMKAHIDAGRPVDDELARNWLYAVWYAICFEHTSIRSEVGIDDVLNTLKYALRLIQTSEYIRKYATRINPPFLWGITGSVFKYFQPHENDVAEHVTTLLQFLAEHRRLFTADPHFPLL